MKKQILLLMITAITLQSYSSPDGKKQSLPIIQSKQDAEAMFDRLSELPNEIQLMIFNYLLSADSVKEFNGNIAHYSQISKRFNQIANSDYGLKKILTARISVIRKEIDTYISNYFKPDAYQAYSFPIPKKTNRRNDTLLLFVVSKHSPNVMESEASPQVLPNAYELALNLIVCGANVNEVNTRTFQTPLMAAVHDPILVKLLLDTGAKQSVNAKDNQKQTALMEAAELGNAVSIKLLLDAGANVNAQNAYKFTPLMYAISAGKEDNVKILLHAGAQVLGIKTRIDGETAQDMAIKEVRKNPKSTSRNRILEMIDDKAAKEWQKYHPMTIM